MLSKKLIIPLLFFVFASSFAIATSWHEKFVSNYEEKGIDLAVEIALREGANPDQIIKKALPIEGLERAVLVKALFCSGAQPVKVEQAAIANAINETTIHDGYQLALTECRRQIEENFNYIVPASKSTGILASPWKIK